MRVYNVMVSFSDSPTPAMYSDVAHIQTEGGLIRLIDVNGHSTWIPLVAVHQIKEISRREQ